MYANDVELKRSRKHRVKVSSGPIEMAEYTLAQDGAEELERARLVLLEAVFDPQTIRQFDAIGVGPGWRCLDVAAGGGSTTRMLPERVGDTGSVLSVDLDVRLLEPLAGERVEVRRHDLLNDPLPDAAFDLVHARNLLMHLPGRLDAMERLLAAVRPGGWLALSEPDMDTMALSPPSPAWRRVVTAFYDATVCGGWDHGYGSRMPADLEVLDLADFEVEMVVRHARGGSIYAQLFAGTFLRFEQRMRELGASGDDLAEVQQMLGDPNVSFRTPATVSAWGRRRT
jgi:SAM-dependent methyltransferase